MNYLTDPLIWKRFYKNMAAKKFNPYSYRRSNKQNRSGRGLHGRFRHSYMIPVNPNAIDNTETNSVNTTMVSPVAAAEERATSEMKDIKEKKKTSRKGIEQYKR